MGAERAVTPAIVLSADPVTSSEYDESEQDT